MRLLLEQRDADTLTRNLRYNDYLVLARRDQMSSYLSALAQLADVEKQLDTAMTALQATQTQLEQQNVVLLASREERVALRTKLDNSIQDKGEAIEQLQRDRDTLQQVIANLERTRQLANIPAPADSAPFADSKGSLPWPLRGRVINHFGESRQGQINWDGLLIGADNGQEVHAIHHGRVMYADWLKGQGLLIILDHGDGYMSLYSHNDALLHEAGEWVRAGDVIAKAGNSGGEKEPALYFEIRYNGQPINPQNWLSGHP